MQAKCINIDLFILYDIFVHFFLSDVYASVSLGGDPAQHIQQQMMMQPVMPARQAARPVSRGPALAPIEAGVYGEYGGQYYSYQ